MSKPTIGVDISKDHLDACRWPGGEICRVSNDAAGHRQLVRWIGGEVARVAFEATGAYHAGFERALHRAGVPASKLTRPGPGASPRRSAPRPRPTGSMPG
jgi:transposase